MLHTGQHYDRELSQVFFDELGLAEPRLPARHAHAPTRRRCGPGSPSTIEAERPDWVLVFGDTNSTLAGALAGAGAGQARRPRRGGPALAATGRCPRSGTGSRSTSSPRCSSAPTSARARQLEREGVAGAGRGGRRRDGRRGAPVRAARARPRPARAASSPAATSVATVHRQANVSQPRLGRIAEGLSRLEEPVVFPAHPRTRAALAEAGIELGAERPPRRAARLPRARRARLAGARDPHRLRRAAEGGVLVRRPVRDDAPLDRVGGHRRGRRERARRRRSRDARIACRPAVCAHVGDARMPFRTDRRPVTLLRRTARDWRSRAASSGTAALPRGHVVEPMSASHRTARPERSIEPWTIRLRR